MTQPDQGPQRQPRHPVHIGGAPGLDPVRGWAVAAVLGGIVLAALSDGPGWPIRAVAAWDAAVLVLLGLPWRVILASDARQDPGAAGTLAIPLLASGVSLVAAVVLLRRSAAYAPAGLDDLLVGLGVIAVAGAWLLMNTAFGLHYAYLYYVDDGTPGGLAFPGDPPDDLDFAYFAFGIGKSFAVSDVSVSDKNIRRVVLLHAVPSFASNTAILALAINLAAGRLERRPCLVGGDERQTNGRPRPVLPGWEGRGGGVREWSGSFAAG